MDKRKATCEGDRSLVGEVSALEINQPAVMVRGTSVDTTVEAVGQVALQEQPVAHVGVTPATSTELEGHVDIAGGSTNTTEPVPSCSGRRREDPGGGFLESTTRCWLRGLVMAGY